MKPVGGTVHAVLTPELGLVFATGIEDARGLGGVPGGAVAVADVAVEGDGGAAAVSEETASVTAGLGTLPGVSGVIGGSASIGSVGLRIVW
jgi:hypothetical protein